MTLRTEKIRDGKLTNIIQKGTRILTEYLMFKYHVNALHISINPPNKKRYLNPHFALTGVAQWVRHHPAKPKVMGSDPGQGTCLLAGSGAGAQVRGN